MFSVQNEAWHKIYLLAPMTTGHSLFNVYKVYNLYVIYNIYDKNDGTAVESLNIQHLPNSLSIQIACI